MVDKMPLNIGVKCGVKIILILFFASLFISCSISETCLWKPIPYAEIDWYIFLYLISFMRNKVLNQDYKNNNKIINK